MTEALAQHAPTLNAPTTTSWHPLSPSEDSTSSTAAAADHLRAQTPTNSYFGLPADTSRSSSSPVPLPSSQADSAEPHAPQANDDDDAGRSRTSSEVPPDFVLMLPQAPHQMSYSTLLKNLSAFTATSSSTNSNTPQSSMITPSPETLLPARVMLPVLSTLTAQLEEARQDLERAEEVRHSQIDSLKALLEQQTPTVSPQVIERTLIRARAAVSDTLDSARRASSSSRTEPPYSSRPWELHVGAKSPSERRGLLDAVAVSDDNKSIDVALDQAMSESHLDLDFAPPSTPKEKDRNASGESSKGGRKRQTSLSARIFGGLVGSSHQQQQPASPSAHHPHRDRHSSRESVPSNAVDSDYNDSSFLSEANSGRPVSPPSGDAIHFGHQKKSSYLSDWASVLTWRSATKHQHHSHHQQQRPATPDSLGRPHSVPPEDPPAAPASQQQQPVPIPPAPSDVSQATAESAKSLSVSSHSTQSTTLGSLHPSLENRPTIESVMRQPWASPAEDDSLEEGAQGITPTTTNMGKPSSPPAPGTPSSAVRALISKKQIEPPALSLPAATTAAASASASEVSVPPPPAPSSSSITEGSSKRDSSPGLALAPNTEGLPHESGPVHSNGLLTEEPEEALGSQETSVQSGAIGEEGHRQESEEATQQLSALPSPSLGKQPLPPASALSRSQSYSSQISRNSSSKDLPRSGSGYVSSMLNKTMALVAHPGKRGALKRANSMPGDSRVEPAVTLPSLGITKQGPVFQLGPASSGNTAQQSNAASTASGAAPSSSTNAAPPPASMELTTMVPSEARPPTFGGHSGEGHLQGMGDLVDRYGFMHEPNGMAMLRELRQRQQDASSSPRPGSSTLADDQENGSTGNENSVKRLLSRLEDMDDADERRLRANWDAFLKRRRAQLAPNEPSTARKERANSLAQSVRAGSGAASLNAGFVEGDEDQWTENLIGVARLGTSGKEGKETWREFKKLVRSGIPMRDRPAIWAELSGANDQREPGYYQELLASHDEGHDSLCLKQIEADVGRTFGTNVFFGGDGPGVAKLRRVLMAYSWHNPEVGYCQGMNLIAGSLLLALPTEEDAFWVLLCIIERILPSEYFTSTLLVSRADQRVLKDLVAKHLPKIHEHMEDVGIELEALSFGWFLSLFSMALPIRTLLRMLDVFFVDGAIVLFRITAAMLQIYAEDILACDNASDLYVFMRTMPGSVHQADRLISLACGEELRAIKTKDVETLREKHVAEMVAPLSSAPKANRKESKAS